MCMTWSYQIKLLIRFISPICANSPPLSFSNHLHYYVGMPINQLCITCGNVEALFRCQLCGPCGFYCWDCFETCHQRTNIFHVAEKWEVGCRSESTCFLTITRICFQNGHFTVVHRIVDHTDVQISHQCSTEQKIQLECVDEYGKYDYFPQHNLMYMCFIGSTHKFRFVSCDCEPLAVILSRTKLWPASPTNPRFAFSFALLDWAEALLLECQVALKDFSSALKF